MESSLGVWREVFRSFNPYASAAIASAMARKLRSDGSRDGSTDG